MDYARLTIALLIPWLGGYCWLRLLEPVFRGNHQISRFSRIGLSFFLGYAALQGVMLGYNAVFGELSFWPLLLIIAVLGGLPVLMTRSVDLIVRAVLPPLTENTLPHKKPTPDILHWLQWLLLAWLALHLLLVAVEILYRPLFPWDAWLNWVYRAKAYFLSSGISAMDSAPLWIYGGEPTQAYNVPGNYYPLLPVSAPLWSALALNYWDDSLINMPTLLCGVALAMSLYGLARESGAPRTLATLGVYALISIPMVSTHLALAGQADIWMAGYTGLGFTALISGLAFKNRWHLIIGVVFIILAITVKQEGKIWFLAGIAMILFATWPRISCILGAVLIAVIALLGAAGITSLDTHLLGPIGYIDGRIYIPLVGSYLVQQFDLADDYLINFLLNGSWHLLWVLIAIGTLCLALPGLKPVRLTIAVFFAVFGLAQMLIFDYTQQGLWAEDFTAINRLPLHFAPGLVYSLVLITTALIAPLSHRNPAPEIAASPRRLTALRALIPPVAAAALVAGASLVFLHYNHPYTDQAPRLFSPTDLNMVVGEGVIDDNAGRITRYENSIALASSGSVYLNADDFKVLVVDTSGENAASTVFFWRKMTEPDDVRTVLLPRDRGPQRLYLGASEDWTGRITEVGLLFYEDEGRAASFHSLQLRPQTLTESLRLVWNDWTQFVPWSQMSVHWIASGEDEPLLPLPLLCTVWLLTALVLSALYWRRPGGVITPALLSICLIWMTLDARWTLNLLFQASETATRYSDPANQGHIEQGGDEEMAQLAVAVKQQLTTPESKILVMAADPRVRFEMLRLKYHLLPLAAAVNESELPEAHLQHFDHILVLKELVLSPGQQPTSVDSIIATLSGKAPGGLPIVYESPVAVLLRKGP